jgi:hypothetical protein
VCGPVHLIQISTRCRDELAVTCGIAKTEPALVHTDEVSTTAAHSAAIRVGMKSAGTQANMAVHSAMIRGYSQL